ncbi:hypothetical protein F4801DRAFT_562108 [Xylaria longipes]|nr:hypothetical protein F4801DRAFT_562108 [Xylaria longipes]
MGQPSPILFLPSSHLPIWLRRESCKPSNSHLHPSSLSLALLPVLPLLHSPIHPLSSTYCASPLRPKLQNLFNNQLLPINTRSRRFSFLCPSPFDPSNTTSPQSKQAQLLQSKHCSSKSRLSLSIISATARIHIIVACCATTTTRPTNPPLYKHPYFSDYLEPRSLEVASFASSAA